MKATNILLAICATTTALMAGLFYAYTCSVSPGLSRLPDAGYLSAMQEINIAIQNPVFFFSFFGTLILLPLSAYLHFNRPVSPRFKYLLAASCVYAIGVFGVTVFGNVPLNEALAVFDLHSASPAAITGQRTQFENPWNALNLVRTFSSGLAIVLVILACLSRQESKRF